MFINRSAKHFQPVDPDHGRIVVVQPERNVLDLTDVGDIASLDPYDLLEIVSPFAASPTGQQILRSKEAPTLNDVRQWIECAKRSRSIRAA